MNLFPTSVSKVRWSIMTKLKRIQLTSFERLKVKEISSLIAQNINPLTVTVGTSGTFYRYNKDDVLNYYAMTHRQFDIII